EGQQPSPCAQAVWVPSSTHWAVQVAAEPPRRFLMQPFQGQVDGQLDAGSQVSPASTAPLPHFGAQSLSLLRLPAAGRQPSPGAQPVCTPSSTPWAWQELPLTSRRS